MSTFILNCSMDEPLLVDKFAALFTQKICHAMDGALKDEIPSVRNMVGINSCSSASWVVNCYLSHLSLLFSLQDLVAEGNIALALKECNSRETMLTLLPQLKSSFSSACECLNDKEEKVCPLCQKVRFILHLGICPEFSVYFTRLSQMPSGLLGTSFTCLFFRFIVDSRAMQLYKIKSIQIFPLKLNHLSETCSRRCH